jgi:hypothetical protein
VCKPYTLQVAAGRQNEVAETRSTHRPVNISDIGAEVVILVKVKCEEVSYRNKTIAAVVTINTRETKYFISSGIHLFQAFFFKECVDGIHKCDF